MQNEKVYTKETMPKINYSVTFNEVKLPSLVSKFLYSDETKVIENSTNEIVGFNRRYMRFFYKLFPDVALGNIYYYPHSMCGKLYTIEIDLFKQINSYGYNNHKEHINNKLYNKYIKGEK